MCRSEAGPSIARWSSSRWEWRRQERIIPGTSAGVMNNHTRVLRARFGGGVALHQAPQEDGTTRPGSADSRPWRKKRREIARAGGGLRTVAGRTIGATRGRTERTRRVVGTMCVRVTPEMEKEGGRRSACAWGTRDLRRGVVGTICVRAALEMGEEGGRHSKSLP